MKRALALALTILLLALSGCANSLPTSSRVLGLPSSHPNLQQRGCCEVTEGKYEITIYSRKNRTGL